jgi:hypothetical protein
MKRVENPDVRDFRTPGTVRDDDFIHMSTA